MPLKPGDRIERYVIDALLGLGGMGEVYRAHDERLQRSVALKILHPEASGDPSGSRPVSQGASRMLREARAVAALEHPNVVAIYDVGQVTEPEALRGTMYLAMELIKGQTLRAYVGDARVAMKERLRWLADVARALGAAHAAGIVHRDVKPENVMIRDGGPVKVLDFGIAKRSGNADVDGRSPPQGLVTSTLTGAGVVMGTPLYMAPEQLRGEALDGRADQFAWGVVAYELIAGRLPWSKDGGAIALVSQVLSSPPPPFDPESDVPPGVRDAVMRALSKGREDRFATMEALLDAFEAPPSPLAQTVGFIPSSGTKRSSAPLGSAPQVIVAEPLPALATLAGSPAPTTGHLTTTTAPSAAPPSRQRRRAIAGAVLAVAFAMAIVAVGTRELARRGAVMTKNADANANAAAASCTSNRACSAQRGGEPYVCRASDRTCVAIASQDCKAMYEPADLSSDDTLWLGAMFPLTGRLAEMGSANMDAVDFARSEVAQAIDSLQGSSIGRKVRRVAVVGCDDSEDGKRAALHLVDDVGVPGILGFRHGQEVVDLAGSLLVDRGVVSVASLTSSPLITRLPQPPNEPRLVWRTSFNFDSLAEATAGFVHDVLEPREQARHPTAVTRVVLVRSGYVAGTAFADTFFRRLVFNGKSALENGHDYQEIVIDPDGGTPTEQVAEQIAQMAPTFVVDLNVGHALELANAVDKDQPRAASPPTYVLVNSATTPLAPFIGASAERRHRVFAVSAVWSSTPNARFVIRYNQARHKELSRDLNPSSSYDAFYLLAYGSFTLPLGAPVTGAALAKNFARLTGPGKSVDVGPTGVFDALNVLVSGGTIDLEGAASGLDFDLSTGEAPFDFALSCPSIDDRGRANGEDVESGVVYSWRAKRSEGALKCR